MSTLKILQLTDLHILPHAGATLLGVDPEYYFAQVLDAAHTRHGSFDLIVLTGDLGQDPGPDSYRRIADRLQRYASPCLFLPGNHDDWPLMQTELNRNQLSCGKHRLFPHWQIIGLNSQKPGYPGGYLADAELLFLNATLETCNLPAVLAVHHHCVASGSPWMDTMMIENGEELLQIAARFPQVKAITCGHLHQEMAKHYRGIQIVSAPATCVQFKPGATEFELDVKPPGYRVFELYDDGTLKTVCYRIDAEQPELRLDLKSY
ncbi:3',5'-cyclic-AMP phosphodiesterase [Methylomonas koyamae]|uniref:3',5'-cyclic-AMP phosphodiesterase n=1 Tax=Methylomonas koyamae TaxID=702114 RepID=UPI001128B64C|nr:3',5'-cyclic-AMP phosphodiesterase [Methylomonas koyamae]TPQ26453.1 3',5'-cyclic-AMP phosphodiesterase [Methylomonas koyamae]